MIGPAVVEQHMENAREHSKAAIHFLSEERLDKADTYARLAQAQAQLATAAAIMFVGRYG